MNGSKRPKPPAEHQRGMHRISGLALLMLLASAAPAGENPANLPPPDEEFLLFLSDWDDGQGDWQDPLEYEDPHWRELDTPQVTDHETPDHR
jgi:hypothetical protein